MRRERNECKCSCYQAVFVLFIEDCGIAIGAINNSWQSWDFFAYQSKVGCSAGSTSVGTCKCWDGADKGSQADVLSCCGACGAKPDDPKNNGVIYAGTTQSCGLATEEKAKA